MQFRFSCATSLGIGLAACATSAASAPEKAAPPAGETARTSRVRALSCQHQRPRDFESLPLYRKLVPPGRKPVRRYRIRCARRQLYALIVAAVYRCTGAFVAGLTWMSREERPCGLPHEGPPRRTNGGQRVIADPKGPAACSIGSAIIARQPAVGGGLAGSFVSDAAFRAPQSALAWAFSSMRPSSLGNLNVVGRRNRLVVIGV